MKRNNYLVLLALVANIQLALGQATSIPVDPLTGKLSLTLPITEVSQGSLNIPVFLRYLSGGVRVNESENSAGIGWQLSAGGAVVREVRGLPDDYVGVVPDSRRGWLSSGIGSAIASFVPGAEDCTGEASDYVFINDRGYIYDTEPDLYTFYGPGISGQFVFGADGFPKTIPYQDVAITKTTGANGLITSFTITNNVGVVFAFTQQQMITRTAVKIGSDDPLYFRTQYEYFKTPTSFAGSWSLANITSPDGNSVSFSYLGFAETLSNRIGYYTPNSTAKTEPYSIDDVTTTLLLSEITTSLRKITFEWDQKLITKVVLNDLPFQTTKRYFFQYVNAYEGTILLRPWHFLKNVIEENSCYVYPSYSFTYYGLNEIPNGYSTLDMAFFNNKRKDAWGFQNATTDPATEAPKIWFYSSQTNADRYRPYFINSADAAEATTSAGTSRAATNVNSIVSVGSIKTIEYPTGSKALIDYEPNSFNDAAANSVRLGAGIRVKMVTLTDVEHDSDPVVTQYDYTLDGTATSGKILYPPMLAFVDGAYIIRTEDNQAPDSYVLYSKTTVKQIGRGKSVYEFNLPGMFPQTTDGDWAATKDRIARTAGCPSPGNQVSGYNLYPFAPNTNYDFERGLPSAITDYPESGPQAVMIRSFTYQRLPMAAVSIKGLRFEKQYASGYSNFVYGFYNLIANTDKVTVTETVQRADELIPTNKVTTITSYAYLPTNPAPVHNLLVSVSTTNSDLVTYKTKYKYAYDINVNAASANPESNGIFKLRTTGRNGTLIETIQSRNDGTETVTGASLTLYKEFGSGEIVPYSVNRVLPYKQLSYPQTSGFVEASGSGTTMTSSANYIPTMTINTYTPTGFVLSAKDHRENKAGSHFGFSDQLLFASINNAYAEEVAYNGFETVTPYALAPVSGSLTLVPGWAGKWALSVTAGQVLARTNISKNGNKYKASCWVNAPTAAQITFTVKNGTTVVDSKPLTYNASDVNQWKFLEVDMNTTAANATFSIEVVSNAAITFDEIRFHPYDATVTSFSYDIINGEIAKVDSRGNAVFTEYDALGRPQYIRNKKKDIVQAKEYHFRKALASPINSKFSPATGSLEMGQPIQFTSFTNCVGLTYLWTVSNADTDAVIVQGAGTLFESNTRSFYYYTPPSTVGRLKVKLTVSHPVTGFSTTENIFCVIPSSLTNSSVSVVTDPTPPDYNASMVDYQYSYNSCYNGNKAISLSLSGGCASPITYSWFYRRDLETNIYSLGNLASFTLSCNTIGGSFTVWCEIAQSCAASSPGCTSSSFQITGELNCPRFHITRRPETLCP